LPFYLEDSFKSERITMNRKGERFPGEELIPELVSTPRVRLTFGLQLRLGQVWVGLGGLRQNPYPGSVVSG
jgi:hypothetical protein